jgi:hypothetical protein
MRWIQNGNLKWLLNSATDVTPALACYGNNCPYTAKATTHPNNMRIFVEIRF